MTWNAPEIEVTIGELTRIGTVKAMEISAARNQPVASLFLELSNIRFEWNDGAEDGDKLTVNTGWRGQELSPLFTGSILRSQLRETFKVWGLCKARTLMDTRVTKTYQEETALAIVEHLIRDCGFELSVLDTYEQIVDKLPLHNNTIVEALHFLNRRLNDDFSFFCDPQGTFRWEQRNETQEPVASFTHGEDIIDFQPLPGGSSLLTAMGTPLWHSQVISIFDRDGNESRYFIEQVRHTVGINGAGLRSHLFLNAAGKEAGHA